MGKSDPGGTQGLHLSQTQGQGVGVHDSRDTSARTPVRRSTPQVNGSEPSDRLRHPFVLVCLEARYRLQRAPGSTPV
ncbi:hypothetical protein FJTKL_03401 [Diaporthe vaccinii]|uniref:Uncharacterized protein n=1 Tax=Diaporthe vaccinii TaxID=105482 RepID=A0ABR4F2D3_9PEZI